jgi:maltose alpha-D-glucosyltransferase / alpha-amylase
VLVSIGKRLGEMHEVLARETPEPAFAPKIANTNDTKEWARKIEERLAKAFDALKRHDKWEREEDRERAKTLLTRQKALVRTVHALAPAGIDSLITRVHGDFHLGQVLVAGGDVFIIDFEGEPATSIDARRAKVSPLRDVAGLLRSIDYVAATLVERKGVGAMPVDETRRKELLTQFRRGASAAFLRAYWQASPLRNSPTTRALLDLLLIEKVAYEICYEAANRPTWIGVPLAGMARMADRLLESTTSHGGRND